MNGHGVQRGCGHPQGWRTGQGMCIIEYKPQARGVYDDESNKQSDREKRIKRIIGHDGKCGT
jgi:hypothetical protein